MKFLTLATLCTIACAAIATAQVPSLINYQGRLTDSEGAPVTGSKNFVISIYDAATGGTLLYTETIGAVTLDDNGVYSFQFGGTGTSNTLATEGIGTTDGTSTTFQKVLDNSPVVANSVSVSDGTYTWSQSAGSSNEDQFGVAYSTSLRRITANYYNGAPAAGRTITATYRHGTSGITGALASGAEHWMAVSVDGTTQGARQRVLAVPYALKASRAESAALADSAVLAQVAQTAYTLNPQSKTWRPHPFLYYSSGSLRYSQLPMSVSSIKMCAFIPNSIKSLNSISIKGVIPPINTTYGRQGAVYIQIIKRSYPSLGQISETVPWSYTKTDVGTVDVSVPVNLTLDQNSAYCISISGGTEEGAISDILFSVTE